jgi:hypothetical protein
MVFMLKMVHPFAAWQRKCSQKKISAKVHNLVDTQWVASLFEILKKSEIDSGVKCHIILVFL